MPAVRETGWLPTQSAGGIWDGGIDLPRAQMGAGPACREMSGSCPFPETSNRAGVVYGVEAERADIWFVWFMSSIPNSPGTQPWLIHDTQRCWSSLGN